jgi:hypothetical protein
MISPKCRDASTRRRRGITVVLVLAPRQNVRGEAFEQPRVCGGEFPLAARLALLREGKDTAPEVRVKVKGTEVLSNNSKCRIPCLPTRFSSAKGRGVTSSASEEAGAKRLSDPHISTCFLLQAARHLRRELSSQACPVALVAGVGENPCCSRGEIGP